MCVELRELPSNGAIRVSSYSNYKSEILPARRIKFLTYCPATHEEVAIFLGKSADSECV